MTGGRRASLAPEAAFPLALLTALLLGGRAAGQVVVSEILYNPPGEKDCEYIELHNAALEAAAIGGWRFDLGIEYVFPEGAWIPRKGFVVLARSPEVFLSAYPSVPPEIVYGGYAGSLANEGEAIRLRDALGAVREEFVYGDDSPWDFLADGFGASLERLCPSESPALPWNWRASRVPASPEERGGTPGAPAEVEECPPLPEPRPPVFISEILYHPVLEESLEDAHEFVEIHNAGTESISIAGWRLAGGIEYSFPAGAEIASGAYLVVAKSRAALLAIAEYGLDPSKVLGDYERELDNGGDKVALIALDGRGVDSVSYDDEFPWPASADALGAGERWLDQDLRPLEQHRYRGRSLERVSFAVPAGEFYNWVASPLDGATPGRPNASAREKPLPAAARVLVLSKTAGVESIRANEEVLVQVRFEPEAPAGPVEIEHFVEDVVRAQKGLPEVARMFDDGFGGGDLVAGDRIYTATLPGKPANTLVRYRIRADREGGSEPVAPEASHPNGWFAYFVSPVINTNTRVYQILISPQNWGQLWTNIQGGRVQGCAPRASWDAQVPAVFIHENRVYDVRVRYQGSRWNRTNGLAISTWPYPRPSVGPLLALSWRIGFPRYARLEGKEALILNKLTQGCPGYNAGMGYRLFDEAGLPGCQARFVRLHINGGYYHYMIELERPGEAMMERYERELAQKSGRPRQQVGHLYKSMGCNCDEGPWGWGDERILSPYCGHAKEVRYAYTYERKTHKWCSHDELIELIEELNKARAKGRDAVRAYLEAYFDVDLLLDYVAIMNWSVPFDDMFQNHFFYQRLSDGKWIVFPWDLDQNFGFWQGAQSSLYMGQQGDSSNRSGWWNYLKDAVLRHYRAEYEDRLLLLNNTILHPDNVLALIRAVTDELDPQEAASAPGGVGCSFSGGESVVRNFAITRHAFVNQKLAGVVPNAGPDQRVFAGQVVQFDASASKPPPGPDAVYTWDNGMEGAQPTWVFEEPGTYVVTLTITWRGIPFRDAVAITVLPLPAQVFRERDGMVVLEAEDFYMNDRQGAADAWWEPGSAVAGFSGAGYVEAKHGSRRQLFSSNYAATAPELRFAIVFEHPGDYRVWVRGLAASSDADSCHVGLDGAGPGSTKYQNFAADPERFVWSGDTRNAGPQVLTVPSPGLHLFSIWIRETGFIADKVVLGGDLEFTPDGEGPPESPREPYGARKPFVRGDANGDSRLNVADAVAILFCLFGGKPLACEDHGDLDDSGAVEVADAVYLVAYLFERGPEPAEPFPEPGYDLTADASDCGSP